MAPSGADDVRSLAALSFCSHFIKRQRECEEMVGAAGTCAECVGPELGELQQYFQEEERKGAAWSRPGPGARKAAEGPPCPSAAKEAVRWTGH